MRPPAQRLVPGGAIALAATGLVALIALWGADAGGLDVPWAPSLDLRLAFELDAMGLLYGLLATGVGIAVFVYASGYMEPRLATSAESLRFYGWLALFMVSMVGLATAQDLILLFIFWDVTAVSSYFLIAHDRHQANARVAALMAMLVTGVTAVLLLIGSLILYAEYGTFSLPELAELVEPGATLTVVGCLIAVAALAKSAQVPFQFWLPRAMVAPTPVSAYLHSAAMVAAGVLLIGRTYPLLEESRLVLDGLLVVGSASILVGGLLALVRDDFKELLAYSTISQYGYVVVMYGLGGGKAAAAAAFYVVSHAMAKSALFMTAGAVTDATGGAKRLSEVGDLLRSLPVLAVASGASVASIVALPLSLGFFADELFFAAALERGTLAAVLSVAAAGLTFAYLGRFWAGIFLGRSRGRSVRSIPALMIAPIAVLGALGLAGGVFPGPVGDLAADAGAVSVLGPAEAPVAYHLDLRDQNLMALASWTIGALLLLVPALARYPAIALSRLGERFGGERAYRGGLALLNRTSDRIHDFEVRDLRTRISAILLPAGVLVLVGLLATPSTDYVVGSIDGETGLIVVLAITSLAAVGATVPRHHLTLALALATVGFSMASVYAFIGGPDVALVAVVVETMFTLLFLGVYSLLPPGVLKREAQLPTGRRRHRRDVVVGLVSGLTAFIVVWATLSRPTPIESVAGDYIELAPAAHGKDIVTVILADFRALDTLGEITVIAIAFAGVVSLLRRGRVW